MDLTYIPYNYRDEISNIIDFKEKEYGNTIFNLIPNLISLVFELFLFLHFWYEEKCCCKKDTCSEIHIVFNIILNCMLGILNIISFMIDYILNISKVQILN